MREGNEKKKKKKKEKKKRKKKNGKEKRRDVFFELVVGQTDAAKSVTRMLHDILHVEAEESRMK